MPRRTSFGQDYAGAALRGMRCPGQGASQGRQGAAELRKVYFFIWLQAAAFSFPMKKYGFETIAFYRETGLPVKNMVLKTFFFMGILIGPYKGRIRPSRTASRAV